VDGGRVVTASRAYNIALLADMLSPRHRAVVSCQAAQFFMEVSDEAQPGRYGADADRRAHGADADRRAHGFQWR
jgi:hypothetical protein